MRLLIFVWLSTLLSASTFELEVGKKYNFNVETPTEITIYKTENTKTKFLIKDKRLAIFFLNDLTLKSDSINSPLAFEIKTKNRDLRCVKRSRNEEVDIKESCAIRKEIESSFIRNQRKHFFLVCSDKEL